MPTRAAPTDRELAALGASVGRLALAAGARIATAESCTAGWVAKALTDTAGSSGWFESGFVTYSDAAKRRDLGVSARTLSRHGAVSGPTVREMARGALRSAGVEIALAVSGIAGPDGGTPEKPVGTVWFCAAVRGASGIALTPSRRQFHGSRDAIRRKSVEHALRLMQRLMPRKRSKPG
jgi:nicotinamide-nucleotide amidase